jgi:hypothetical protein
VGTLALIRAHKYRRALLQMRTFLTHFVGSGPILVMVERDIP